MFPWKKGTGICNGGALKGMSNRLLILCVDYRNLKTVVMECTMVMEFYFIKL